VPGPNKLGSSQVMPCGCTATRFGWSRRRTRQSRRSLAPSALALVPHRFLVPLGAETDQRTSEASLEDIDQPGEAGGTDDDDVSPESTAAKRRYMPSSIGLSVLVPGDAQQLRVAVSWGDYHLQSERPEQWERRPRSEILSIDLSKASEKAREKEVQESAGLYVAYLARPVGKAATDAGLPEGARTVLVFVVNRRAPSKYARAPKTARPPTPGLRLRSFLSTPTSALCHFPSECAGFRSRALVAEHVRTVYNSRNRGCPRPPQTPTASFKRLYRKSPGESTSPPLPNIFAPGHSR
jgi:hypothetical protein